MEVEESVRCDREKRLLLLKMAGDDIDGDVLDDCRAKVRRIDMAVGREAHHLPPPSFSLSSPPSFLPSLLHPLHFSTFLSLLNMAKKKSKANKVVHKPVCYYCGESSEERRGRRKRERELKLTSFAFFVRCRF